MNTEVKEKLLELLELGDHNGFIETIDGWRELAEELWADGAECNNLRNAADMLAAKYESTIRHELGANDEDVTRDQALANYNNLPHVKLKGTQ